jgi:hypothetical protein
MIEINPKIVEHIAKIRRRCLWNKKTDKGKVHLLAGI